METPPLSFVPLLITPRNSASHAEYYITQSPPPDEESKGKLVIIVEVTSRERSAESIASSIIEWWEHEFKNHPPSPQSSSLLENLCKSFNEDVYTLTGKKKEWIFSRIHFLCALFHGTTLSISQTGNATGWVITKTKMQNIAAQDGSEKERVSLLSHIVTGPLQEGTTFLFTTQSLFDFFSLDKISETIRRLSLPRAIELFQNLYPEGANQSLALVLTKPGNPETEGPAPEIDGQQKEKTKSTASHARTRHGTATPPRAKGKKGSPGSVSQLSVEELRSLEHRTDALLNASSLTEVKGFVTKIKERMPRIPFPRRSHTTAHTGKKTILFFLAYPLLVIRSAFKSLSMRRGSEGTPSPSSPLGPLLHLLPKKGNIKNLRAWRSSIARLSRRQKTALSLAFLIFLLFFASIVAVVNNNINSRKEARIAANVALIEGKIAAVEAALIYQDEEKARRLLSESRNLLAAIPDRERTPAVSSLEARVKKLSQTVFRVTILDSVSEVADFQALALSGNENPNPKFLSLADGWLATVNMNTNDILLYNPARKEKAVISDTPKQGRFSRAALFDPSSLLLLHGNEFYLLKPAGQEIENLSLAVPDTIAPAAIAAYVRRIYLVDETSGRIFRSTPRGGGYSAFSAWLDEAYPFSPRSSLAIDGSIYAASDTDAIARFDRGALTKEYNFSSLTPPLRASSLFTAPGMASLYVLDIPNRRIIAIDKETGNLKQQYLSSNFSQPKDIAVDAQERTLYLLDGARVLSFPLSTP